MDAHERQLVVILADISGYTRFMLAVQGQLMGATFEESAEGYEGSGSVRTYVQRLREAAERERSAFYAMPPARARRPGQLRARHAAELRARSDDGAAA
jgi:hypothetical protein